MLTPADDKNHINKHDIKTPFVNGATNIGEACRRIGEGAAMIRTKGEAGTGNVIEAVNSGNLLIASNIDTFKEVMGDTALFFKSNDIKSLEKVINYCSNNNLHQQWVKQFNHIKKYDIDKLINKWISIYMHS